ncbi:DUF6123 family protein [Pontibacillus litoralis]|uniref:Uncharacterized protein n=1 Tax=Pontibacillus litoralis JSM 072002 TaxID=1385512 RepID=A0A0A5HWA5_9BACI|nr:DUF6123 family protein [Pontibacillus litoralis]KGX87912.1 hypothetical protein N784_12455 [Pontibacillus litoralis JSM 072002]
MKGHQPLAYYIEDLWTKGFKLSDKDIHFIYFGKNYTNSEDWLVISAVRATLQAQLTFDGSFFIAVLEYLSEQRPRTSRSANQLLQKKGIPRKKAMQR